jgi:hypothetical protein
MLHSQIFTALCPVLFTPKYCSLWSAIIVLLKETTYTPNVHKLLKTRSVGVLIIASPLFCINISEFMYCPFCPHQSHAWRYLQSLPGWRGGPFSQYTTSLYQPSIQNRFAINCSPSYKHTM